MRKLIILIALVLIGCGGKTIKRTRYSDPSLRIFLDPASIDEKNFVRIQAALMATGKFFVVTRQAGFRAIKAEQERLHRDEVDRYNDREKWAHWQELYSVNGIVRAASQCSQKYTILQTPYQKCTQFLSIINASTGEVIVAIENVKEADYRETASWYKTAEILVDNYPENYEVKKWHKKIEDYRDESQEHAIRQKENISYDEIQKEKKDLAAKKRARQHELELRKLKLPAPKAPDVTPSVDTKPKNQRRK